MDFKSIAGSINLMPIRGLLIFHKQGSRYNGVDDNFTRIYQLESESSFKLSPVERPHMKGFITTQGYKLEASIYVPHNVYYSATETGEGLLKRMEYTVREAQAGLKPQLMILLGDNNMWGAENPPEAINSTAGGIFDCGLNCSFTYSIESVEVRPRMIIKISAVIKDILASWGDAPFISVSV